MIVSANDFDFTAYQSGDYGDHCIIHGDCRDVLPKVCTVGVVLTDPPYSSGGYQESGGSTGSIGTTTGAQIAGDNLSTRGYCRLIREVAAGTRAREIYIFCDWRMWTYTADAIEDGFFRLRSMIVWNKITPGMGVGWRGQHELICFGKRGAAKTGTAGHGNVLTIKRSGNNAGHPTEKPVDLIMEIIRQSEDGVILDPFLGSGTTLVAAKNLGRRAIGVEISREYCEIAEQRLAQEVLSL